jgi:hypothetical protein
MSYIAIWCLHVAIDLPLYSINAKIKVEKWLGPIQKGGNGTKWKDWSILEILCKNSIKLK